MGNYGSIVLVRRMKVNESLSVRLFNKVISDPYKVKMKKFYVGVDIDYFSGIEIPVERKRKIEIHLCDDCFKGLHAIAEKKEREK